MVRYDPVIAVDAAGRAHVIFTSKIMDEYWLFHALLDETGIGAVSDIISGAGAGEPDLIAYHDGLMLAFVRDNWIPGWREVCTQAYDGATWSEPEMHYSGLSIWSPSLAWDRDRRLLLAFLLDNLPGAPLLAHAALHRW